jgi:hypothetical protein
VAVLHSSSYLERLQVSPTKPICLFLTSMPFRDLGYPAHESVMDVPLDWPSTNGAQGRCCHGGISQPLFAAEIPFGRSDADVP